MLPLALLPGFAQWGAHLEELIARPEALWIHGPVGSGVSTLAAELAARRGVPMHEATSEAALAEWLAGEPRGVVAARSAPGSLRWKLLGQSPTCEPAGPPRFEAEDLATNLHALERYLLHQALRRAYGNRVEAARRLGVSRRQLYLLIRRHGDPVRGDEGLGDLPRRVQKRRPTQNSSPDPEIR